MHEFLCCNARFENLRTPIDQKSTRPFKNARETRFKLAAKTRMLELDLTVTEIAAQVGCSRTCASQAINHGLHEPTRRKIATLLNLSS